MQCAGYSATVSEEEQHLTDQTGRLWMSWTTSLGKWAALSYCIFGKKKERESLEDSEGRRERKETFGYHPIP
jgi:hypothetical protein